MGGSSREATGLGKSEYTEALPRISGKPATLLPTLTSPPRTSSRPPHKGEGRTGEGSIDRSVHAPRRVLSTAHAAAVVVGMVVGAGIFRSASVAAQNLPSEGAVLIAWGLGGVFALAGALCYAELTTAFPHPGGDYHFLREAFGAPLAFVFAWSRFAVIFTASSAMLAFVGADYLAQIVPLSGPQRAGVAALAIVALTALNLRGVRTSATSQVALVSLDCAALLALGGAAIMLIATGTALPAHPVQPPAHASLAGFGATMVFVMLAYGGFNDSATLSAEVRAPGDMTRALVGGMAVVTALYLIANWAYLSGLGLGGLAGSDAPAAALMGAAFGPAGAAAIVALVGVTTLSSLNALVIVGGRTLYAAAGDQPLLGRLAQWDQSRGVPRAAVWTQAAFSLALVGWGAWTRRGFAAMVDYMAPVYWLFLALAGLALVVLRRKRPGAKRPYRTPLLPLTAGTFIVGSLFVLAASVAYVGWIGCALSFGVLAAGPAALWLARRLL
jgi:basic amino acid/polyamine antiporter, APA family